MRVHWYSVGTEDLMATHETQTAGQEPLVRDISDTALWAAVFRGRENDRPDALFRDPYAARLAGDRGGRIAQEMKFGTRHTWSWIARTYVADQIIGDEIAEGTDMVVNLAASLDTRPYRMSLPFFFDVGGNRPAWDTRLQGRDSRERAACVRAGAGPARPDES